MAEQADLGAACQRQGSVVVLQQGSALGLNGGAQLCFVSLALFVGSKARFEVFGIFRSVALDDLIGRCIQSNVQGGGVLICNHVAHDGGDGQNRRQRSEHRPQTYFGFLGIHWFSSFSFITTARQRNVLVYTQFALLDLVFTSL